MKPEVQAFVEQAERHQRERLIANEPGRLDAYTLEIDIINKLKRAYYHARRMAKAVRHSD